MTTPTTTQDPTSCHVCGRHAVGIGLGRTVSDPRWLCKQCVEIVEHIRSAKRLDAYELKARAGGMDAAAGLVQEYGANLAEWEEDQVLNFCGAVWRGCSDRLRELIVEGSAPF